MNSSEGSNTGFVRTAASSLSALKSMNHNRRLRWDSIGAKGKLGTCQQSAQLTQVIVGLPVSYVCRMGKVGLTSSRCIPRQMAIYCASPNVAASSPISPRLLWTTNIKNLHLSARNHSEGIWDVLNDTHIQNQSLCIPVGDSICSSHTSIRACPDILCRYGEVSNW